MAKVPRIKLNNNLTIPALGLGTWQGSPGKEAEVAQAVKDAIDIGYRHFDCAHHYLNEGIIGEAIREKIVKGVVKREDLFITSKLWLTYYRPELVEPACKHTLKELQLDYLDLYLLHWPFSFKEGDALVPIDPKTGLFLSGNTDYVDTWKAVEAVQRRGLTKSIGVSNFNSKQIERLLRNATITPVTNQVECHPYLNQNKLRKFCLERNIILTAYSPLGSPTSPWRKTKYQNFVNDRRIEEIAMKYKKSPAQVLLRYSVQLGNCVVPKSSNKQRLKENIDIFDFHLSEDDMDFLKTLDCNGRVFSVPEARNIPYYPFSPDVEF